MTDVHDFVQEHCFLEIFCTGIFFYIIIYQEHSEVAEHDQSKDFHC